jgi:hypothetical protein
MITVPNWGSRTTRVLVLLAAVAGTSWVFTQRKAFARDKVVGSVRGTPVDARRAAWWASNEKEVSAAGARLIPISIDPNNLSEVPFADGAPLMLRGLTSSERHGSGETRLLSMSVRERNGNRTAKSSGVLAQVSLINGSEYKLDADFLKGWIPLIKIVVSDSSSSDSIVYPQLKLRGGTSWLYVHEVSNTQWVGSLVRIVNDKVEQESVPIDAASNDQLEPIKAARFVWIDGDEAIWGYCGGSCCKIRTTTSGPPALQS